MQTSTTSSASYVTDYPLILKYNKTTAPTDAQLQQYRSVLSTFFNITSARISVRWVLFTPSRRLLQAAQGYIEVVIYYDTPTDATSGSNTAQNTAALNTAVTQAGLPTIVLAGVVLPQSMSLPGNSEMQIMDLANIILKNPTLLVAVCSGAGGFVVICVICIIICQCGNCKRAAKKAKRNKTLDAPVIEVTMPRAHLVFLRDMALITMK
jgi:hypothetical protein